MTPTQLRIVRVYLEHRDRPMSIGSLLWANRRLYLVLAVIFGISIYATHDTHPVSTAVAIAVAITILARDIGYFRQSAMIWPTLRDLLDWDKIEAMAKSDASAPN